MKLYRFDGATCAAKVRMALHEKDVEFEDIRIERSELSEPWYLALNPNGVVPTLVVGDEVIIESTIILNYLGDAFEGTSLRPESAIDRARMNAWMKRMDEALVYLGSVTYAIALRHTYLALSPEELDAALMAIPDPDRRASRRALIEQGLEAEAATVGIRELEHLQKDANEALADADYLCSQFSMADISLAAFAWRLEPLGLLNCDDYGALANWWARMQQRPAFERGIVGSTPVQIQQGLHTAYEKQRAQIAAARASALNV